jgi:alpha-tubulin suppressor-like RCC1 family protein
MEGNVYFWGQYSYPITEKEPKERYGRILSPKLLTSLSNEFIIDIKAGSSHSLALTDRGQVYSWGHGMSG